LVWSAIVVDKDRSTKIRDFLAYKFTDSQEQEIKDLDILINDPETGLLAQIKDTEEALADNVASQTSETAQRTEENLAYQKNIDELVEAKDLITKALTVLKAYYEEAMQTDGTGFIQTKTKREDPAPPSTWTEYEGQSGEGNSAITMLEFILKSTKAEETEAHGAESEAQTLYEESMKTLKAEEAEAQKLLADMQGELAEKEKELLDKR